jgi:hypothetical protein
VNQSAESLSATSCDYLETNYQVPLEKLFALGVLLALHETADSQKSCDTSSACLPATRYEILVGVHSPRSAPCLVNQHMGSPISVPASSCGLRDNLSVPSVLNAEHQKYLSDSTSSARCDSKIRAMRFKVDSTVD